MLKRVFYSLAIVLLMAGCSSTKLDNPPVTNAGAMGGAGSGSGAASGVAPVSVDANARNAQGPVGVARVIYFDFDSYTVKPDYQSVIDAHARFLKANPQRHVTLEGNTDDRGGSEYNLALGQKRAEAVARALKLLGVGDNQVEAISFGKEKPAVSGSGEEVWAQNRRVEFSYR